VADFENIVPVAVLTGFLGSGKSTLLNQMLRSQGMPPTAVVINELGEVGIDNLLIERVTEGIALLNSGCLCCTVRSDLEQTLQDLYLKRVRGVIPNFSRMVIETTGLADPGPILQTLLSRALREKRYELSTVLTTVDAVEGAATISRYPEALRQVVIADRLIVTKSDLGKPALLEKLEAQLSSLNALATRVRVTKGEGNPQAVLGTSFLTGEQHGDLRRNWAERATWYRQSHRKNILRKATDDPEQVHHTAGVRADCYILESPIDWDVLSAALKELLLQHGERLLRFKAIVQLQALEEPVALHAVHHTLYPPETLPKSQVSGVQESRLVFISERTDRGVFDALIDKLARVV